MITKKKLIHYIRWSSISSLVGLLAGIASVIFIKSLSWATETREANLKIIWLLPLAGLLSGWLYYRHGRKISGGTNLIIEEIHNPKNVVPFHMAPFILFSSVLTHLFGGSAGREGAIVQMGASLSDQISHVFKMSSEERKVLLTAGTGAAFGAALGTPWAGIIFGMEVVNIERLKTFAIFECFIASFVGYYTTSLLGLPHTHYSSPGTMTYNFEIFFYVALAGIAFGITAKLFSKITHQIEKFHSKFISYAPLRPFFGGVLLVLLFSIGGNHRYLGLGISSIQEALNHVVSFDQPTLKFIFSTITVGSGFKGGEFIPLVFIGTTLGSALSIILPVSFKLLAALGFAAVFAGASNTPLACSIMAIEIFGLNIAPYALIACYVSYYSSGHHGIYKGQKSHQKKYQHLYNLILMFGELPKKFLNKKDHA